MELSGVLPGTPTGTARTFDPALARIDTGLLPADPPYLPAFLLSSNVYQSVLASDAYAGQWQMIRRLDRARARVVLGVWGGPDQFTDDGTRRGVVLPSHYDDYVDYVTSIVDFLVGPAKAARLGDYDC